MRAGDFDSLPFFVSPSVIFEIAVVRAVNQTIGNMNNAAEVFQGATDIETRTELFQAWMKSQDDDVKLRYAINWKMPHTLFNVSCKFFNSEDIQNIDWYKIYKSRDIGTWSHKGKVMTL
jgi:hypothetical protein